MILNFKKKTIDLKLSLGTIGIILTSSKILLQKRSQTKQTSAKY